MLALIPFTFGNRRPDCWGNVHCAWDDNGRLVIKHKPPYIGRHRDDDDAKPSWWWEGPLKFLAWLAGERV